MKPLHHALLTRRPSITGIFLLEVLHSPISHTLATGFYQCWVTNMRLVTTCCIHSSLCVSLWFTTMLTISLLTVHNANMLNNCVVLNRSDRANKSYYRFPKVIKRRGWNTQELSDGGTKAWLAKINRFDLTFDWKCLRLLGFFLSNNDYWTNSGEPLSYKKWPPPPKFLILEEMSRPKPAILLRYLRKSRAAAVHRAQRSLPTQTY